MSSLERAVSLMRGCVATVEAHSTRSRARTHTGPSQWRSTNRIQEILEGSPARDYFLAAFAFAYFFWKRSTRPAVSTSFCLPVKNGWQFEQISTCTVSFTVARVSITLPQTHTILVLK